MLYISGKWSAHSSVFTVQFYETEDGQKPVYEFLLSLEPKMRAKMGAMMELLADLAKSRREDFFRQEAKRGEKS